MELSESSSMNFIERISKTSQSLACVKTNNKKPSHTHTQKTGIYLSDIKQPMEAAAFAGIQHAEGRRLIERY